MVRVLDLQAPHARVSSPNSDLVRALLVSLDRRPAMSSARPPLPAPAPATDGCSPATWKAGARSSWVQRFSKLLSQQQLRFQFAADGFRFLSGMECDFSPCSSSSRSSSPFRPRHVLAARGLSPGYSCELLGETCSLLTTSNYMLFSVLCLVCVHPILWALMASNYVQFPMH